MLTILCTGTTTIEKKNNVCVLWWTTKKDILQWFCWQKHERRLKIHNFQRVPIRRVTKNIASEYEKRNILHYHTIYVYIYIYICKYNIQLFSSPLLHFTFGASILFNFLFLQGRHWGRWSITWRRRHWHWAVWNDPHCHALCISHRSCPGNRGGFFAQHVPW